jgi:hypothetical protein
MTILVDRRHYSRAYKNHYKSLRNQGGAGFKDFFRGIGNWFRRTGNNIYKGIKKDAAGFLQDSVLPVLKEEGKKFVTQYAIPAVGDFTNTLLEDARSHPSLRGDDSRSH